MSMVVKAFLEKAGDPKGEIRRFNVPGDVTSSYAYISGKVSEVFPNLMRRNFSMYWKDQDGDLVSFSSDAELLEALGFVNDGVFKIYVKENSSGPQLIHPGVYCDGCNGPIHGVRFKCFQCPNYDLCADCEAKGLHPEHEMCKIPTPRASDHGPMPSMPFTGMPPPQMRRWMKRYMKQLHCQSGCPCNNDGPQNETDQADAGPEEKPDQKEEETTPEDYLSNVGQNLQAMLNPLGVVIDVEHHGRRHGCHKPGPYFRGHGCGRGRGPWHHGHHGNHGGCGFQGCGGGFGRCGYQGRGPHCPMRRFMQENATGENEQTMESDQTQESAKDGETEKESSSTASGSMTVIEHTSETGEPQMVARRHCSDDEWTILNDAFRRNAVIQPSGSPLPATSVPLHPDPKINDALKQMLSMGFNNDGGWLASLLEAKNGDISQVISAIDPQRSMSGNTS